VGTGTAGAGDDPSSGPSGTQTSWISSAKWQATGWP